MFFPGQPSPTSRLGRPLNLAPHVRLSRCFRTGPDGRIALTTDWPALLKQARRAGPLALQTRHACARLITLTAMPALVWGPERRSARDESGELHFNFEHWHRAWGLLRPCDCCASPGRIEVGNATGREFLQFCAMPGAGPLAWADILDPLVADGAPATTADAGPDSRSAFPLLPHSAVRLPSDIDALAPFLAVFGEEQVPLRCTLRTPEVCRHREFAPREVAVHDGILSASEAGTRLQLALPAVRGLALTASARGWALHCTGAGNAVLLTLSAASDPIASAIWHGALRAAFSSLR